MTSRVLDACTLINLHCGWNGVGELLNLGIQHFVGDVVSTELIYVRELDEHGLIVQRKLTREESRLEYPVPVLSMASPAEQGMMVRFAAKIDDGEAEGLAIAHARGFVFCSDDEPVHKLVRAEGLGVGLITTPEILLAWANGDPVRAARLPEVIRRIATLARFRPHRTSPHLAWWEQQLRS